MGCAQVTVVVNASSQAEPNLVTGERHSVTELDFSLDNQASRANAHALATAREPSQWAVQLLIEVHVG